MTALLLPNNSLALEKNSFAKYRKLRLLHLGGTGLTEMPEGVFRGLNNLTKLFLTHNLLRELRPESLEDLESLIHLDLTDNRFTEFDGILTSLPSLDTVWLNGNLITLKGRIVSPNAHFPQELFLENNQIEELTKDSLIGLSGLHSLYLRHNKISRIEDGAFAEQKLLVDLELNFNRIQYIHPDTFLGLDSLVSLNLDGNPLVSMAEATFKRIPLLASLHLYQMELSTELLLNISDAHMDSESPTNLYHVYFKRFRYCGYLPSVPDCWPKTDGVSSFEHLLVRMELRVGVWLVAMLTLLGNMTVLFGRVLNRDDNKILSLFIRNLAVADLCTGVYLLVMASKDLQFRSEYHEHAYYWMSSWQCTITGVLAVTSSEVSVMILSFMSVERWLCITWPLGSPKLSLGRAKLALVVIWAAGFALAIAPVFYYTNRQGFYGTNGLCFPLHLDDPWVPGWMYSAVVFVGLNQLGVVMILISYTWMFCSIRKTRANTPLALGDREFAIRFFFIVFTDCVCWIPIIILRVLALSSTNIPPELYAWVVVVLLPVNSAINPFLYTFTTTKFRTHAKRLFSDGANCRWPQRRDSATVESEVTRTSTLRTATYKWNNGRDIFHLNNGTTQSIDDSAVLDVTKTKEDQSPAETKL
ncbi:relaxin receptor 1-like isoform X2 [Macrobrachium nipponense]